MSSTLIPWRSCEVRIRRARTIGTSWTRFGQDGFLGDIYLIARYGERDDSDETRQVLRGGFQIDPVQIDWTGFFEAFSAIYPGLASRWQAEAGLRKAQARGFAVYASGISDCWDDDRPIGAGR